MLNRPINLFPLWFVLWIVFASLSVLLGGTTYVAVQQSFRQSADDPQISMAEDIATKITNGGNPTELLATSKPVDIATSLLPYLIVFNSDGKALVGTGILHGVLPTLPSGVFEYAKKNGEHRFSWQPEKGVRSAVVLIPYQGDTVGFVLAGRSLRETENRESLLAKQVSFGLFLALVGSLLGALFISFCLKRA